LEDLPLVTNLQAGQSCIVVGAGISGLLAARELASAGIRVVVVDKSRGVGGRMSTRRIENIVFDHGAQFVTVRDPVFAGMAEEWSQLGLIAEWSHGFPQPSRPVADGNPRYFVPHGMTALPKHLAAGLEVHTNARVSGISLDGNWRVRLASGKLAADGLILTSPVPQSLDLLDLGGVELPSAARASLNAIRYDPCLTWMAIPTSETRLPAPGAIQLSTGPLQFIADNQQKGISPEAVGITVHTGAEFSRRYFDADEIENWGRIVAQVAEFTGPLRRASFQRWRYAKPVETHSERCLMVGMGAPLVFCGDAFGGPRIEGAALSGLAAARSIMGL
jgi:predicted NAD/FAD-dependent oxidoreductase